MTKLDPTKMDNTQSPTLRSRAYVRTRVVREYFLRHPGVKIWLIDLREAQQAAGCYDGDRQILSAINNTRNGGIMNIQTLTRGQSWIYLPNRNDSVRLVEMMNLDDEEEAHRLEPAHHEDPPAKPTLQEVVKTILTSNLEDAQKTVQAAISERLYREKMVTKSGDRILEDEDGILFRAKELDL